MRSLVDDYDYPTYELGIYVNESRSDDLDGLTRKQTGDIVICRPAYKGVGLKEMYGYIWLRAEGWSKARFDSLTSRVYPHSQVDPRDDRLMIDSDEDEIEIEKFRYRIPLEAFMKLDLSFDISRAEDELDLYQPFMLLDAGDGEDDRINEGLFLVASPAFNLDGIVFDKAQNCYIEGY